MTVRSPVGQFLLGIVFTIIALFALVIGGLPDFQKELAYATAPTCGERPVSSCRATVQLTVLGVREALTKGANETIIDFEGAFEPATFNQNDVYPSDVTAGQKINGEVWNGEVTAVTIGGVRHESFATQPNAWVGAALTFLMVVVGIVVTLLPIIQFVRKRL